MNLDEKLAFYFLDLHASGSERHYVSHNERHLNECSGTVVSDVRVTEALAVEHSTTPNTYVFAHFRCPHGWGMVFEHDLFGYAQYFRDSADIMITG